MALRYVFSDGWLLLSVDRCGDEGGDLRGVLATADYLNHGIPTYDELSMGLSKLMHDGLVERAGERFRATTKLQALKTAHGFTWRHRWDGVRAMLALGAPPTGSEGQPAHQPAYLPACTEAEYQAALAAYRRR